MKNVLVTGSQGFVGSHFVKRLLRDGCRVTAIDDFSSKGTHLPKPHPALTFLQADCRPFFQCSSACEFDTVFHLAAVVGGRLKIDGDPLAVATDLAIDSDLFNWLSCVPKKPQLIYFSSSAAYPTSRQRQIMSFSTATGEAKLENPAPLKEEEIFGGARVMLEEIGQPDMTYGWAKLTGEYLASFAAKQYDLDVKIYRPFSGYGPGQSLDYPFPSIVQRVMRHEKPVVVWGSGSQLRDFIYIGDVVDAVLATKDKLKPGEALNLGSGVGTSFRQLAHKIGEVIGTEVEVINDVTKPEGVFARVADATKFRSLYPKDLTPLADGIRAVIEDLTVGSE